jgi:hypothetical protein
MAAVGNEATVCPSTVAVGNIIFDFIISLYFHQ